MEGVAMLAPWHDADRDASRFDGQEQDPHARCKSPPCAAFVTYTSLVSSGQYRLPKAIRRACVFCAGEPQQKNREHILPEWLLELTGEHNRVVTLGYDWANQKPLTFAWDQLTAPACKRCNDVFAKLEDKAKQCILRLMNDDLLDGAGLDLVLRWLDKVRVGLWRLNNVLGAGPIAVSPSFSIRSRMDVADRSMIALRLRPRTGLNTLGTWLPTFFIVPTCFGLVVNDLALVNVSTQGLFGGRAGFPWTDVRAVAGNGQLLVTPRPGTDVVAPPLITVEPIGAFASKWDLRIVHQWAVLVSHFDQLHEWTTDWGRAHSLRPGLGRPMVEEYGRVVFVDPDVPVPVVSEFGGTGDDLARLVAETQVAMARSCVMPPEAKDGFATLISATERLLGGFNRER